MTLKLYQRGVRDTLVQLLDLFITGDRRLSSGVMSMKNDIPLELPLELKSWSS